MLTRRRQNRWSSPFDAMESMVDSLVRDSFAPLTGGSTQRSRTFQYVSTVQQPWIDRESDRTVISVPVPGFDEDDTRVTLHDGVLEVEAGHPNADDNYVRFRTSLDDRAYQTEEVEASFHNGLLRIALPHRTSDAPDGEHVIDISVDESED